MIDPQDFTQKALSVAIYAFLIILAVYILTTPWR